MFELEYLTKFRMIEDIATGGMGSVYIAEQLGAKEFRKTVAIKTIRSSLISDPETLEMFIGEAKLVADLIHENIVQVYQFEEKEGMYYLVMEYVAGQNLQFLMERLKFMGQTIPIDLGAFVISQIARGLDYAHKKRDREGRRLRIVHRDISPSNVIISYYGVAKLTDFGIAKALTMKVPDEREVLMGKYPYMSPEQAKFEGTDARSDIFSLGVVAYELLAGRPLYNVNDSIDLLNAMKEPVIEPSLQNPEVPERLSDIIMKAIQIAPERRFQSAGELRETLDIFLAKSGYWPNNERLATYIKLLFPESKKKMP